MEVRLDFAPSRPRITALSLLIAIAGGCALVAATMEYRSVADRRAALEQRLADAQRRNEHAPEVMARNAKSAAEGAGITRELATPWTEVLADLESAAGDTAKDTSVLAIEPDHDKHRIVVKAESRDLPHALEYLKRVQHSRSLLHPMLDSHEVAADDKDRPVRFAFTADWRELP
ncbi:MAG: hypothetical protein JSR36_09605 [Proteobacteria bacterium]|nr:hypothetical protein [Pseudomonadota bacterium]